MSDANDSFVCFHFEESDPTQAKLKSCPNYEDRISKLRELQLSSS